MWSFMALWLTIVSLFSCLSFLYLDKLCSELYLHENMVIKTQSIYNLEMFYWSFGVLALDNEPLWDTSAVMGRLWPDEVFMLTPIIGHYTHCWQIRMPILNDSIVFIAQREELGCWLQRSQIICWAYYDIKIKIQYPPQSFPCIFNIPVIILCLCCVLIVHWTWNWYFS